MEKAYSQYVAQLPVDFLCPTQPAAAALFCSHSKDGLIVACCACDCIVCARGRRVPHDGVTVQSAEGVVRDPWFPIALMLTVLLGIWLGIFGPMSDGFTKGLQGWQTLIAAVVAAVAVIIAFKNTDRSLAHAESLETNRRRRKHAAVRAVLPLALSQVIAYAERSARALNDLVSKCEGETLPACVTGETLVEPLPSETLKSLADFIEYTDATSVEVLESTVAWIQIFDSRMRALVQHNNDPTKTWVVVRTEIEGLIIDAATIYAGAASAFDYARRR